MGFLEDMQDGMILHETRKTPQYRLCRPNSTLPPQKCRREAPGIDGKSNIREATSTGDAEPRR